MNPEQPSRNPRTITQRIPFTQPRIDRLPIPATNPVTVHDAELRGLAVRIFPGGTKTFEVFKRVKGKPVRVTLGRFPALNVATARKLARAELNRMSEGLNPNEQKRKEREAASREITFGAFFEEYLSRHAESHTRGGAEKARGAFRLHLRAWARRPLSSMTHRDIQETHSRIARRMPVQRKDGKLAKVHTGGQRAANLCVALLSHMFNKARAWGYFIGDNPARGVEKFRETPRERWLRPDEAPAFFNALVSEPNSTMRDIFTTLLLTGQRKGNVLAMRWEHIDLDRATWEIPATETKAQNRIEVPLHSSLVKLLRTRRPKAGRSPWVFPGRGSTGHVQEIKKAWRELTKRAGLTDFRPHDLRHTYASWQVASGVHLRVISKALGHRSPLTVNRYAHVDVEPVRRAMQMAGDALLGAGKIQRGPLAIAAPLVETSPVPVRKSGPRRIVDETEPKRTVKKVGPRRIREE